MEKSYSKYYLNSTAQRWITTSLEAPQVDCRGCHKLTKCCAFQPFIPNYLLGAIFRTTELPKHKNLRFEPIGAIPTASYREKHSLTQDKENAVDLLCAFYKNGECSIWENRPGECSTYYCDDQMKSQARQDLSKQAFDTEIAVAQMALVELGLDPEQISRQVDACNTSEDLPEKYSDQELILMYKQAWNWSKQLSASQVRGWLK